MYNPITRGLKILFWLRLIQQQRGSFSKEGVDNRYWVATSHLCGGPMKGNGLFRSSSFFITGSFSSTIPYVLAVSLYCMSVFNTNFRKISVFPSAIART